MHRLLRFGVYFLLFILSFLSFTFYYSLRFVAYSGSGLPRTYEMQTYATADSKESAKADFLARPNIAQLFSESQMGIILTLTFVLPLLSVVAYAQLSLVRNPEKDVFGQLILIGICTTIASSALSVYLAANVFDWEDLAPMAPLLWGLYMVGISFLFALLVGGIVHRTRLFPQRWSFLKKLPTVLLAAFAVYFLIIGIDYQSCGTFARIANQWNAECLAKKAIAHHNAAYCDKSTRTKEECYFYVAVVEKNPALCDHVLAAAECEQHSQ